MTATPDRRLISRLIVPCLFSLGLLAGCGEDAANSAKEAVSNAASSAGSSMKEAAEKVSDSVAETTQKVTETASNAVSETVEKAAETAGAAGEAAKTAVANVTSSTSETPEPATSETTDTQTATPAPQPEPSAAQPTVAANSAAVTPAAPDPKPAPVKRTGAHGATVDFFTALQKGDAKAAVAMVDGTDVEKSALEARANYQRASVKFKTAFVNRFGAAAWDKFNDPEHLPEAPNSQRPPFNARLSVFEQNDLDQMLLYKPQENGDEAIYPDEQSDLKLVRKDGKWKLVAASLLPPGADGAEKASQILAASATHVARFTQAIGMDSVSADDIDTELGRAIVETLYGFTSQEPHRFDVKSLK